MRRHAVVRALAALAPAFALAAAIGCPKGNDAATSAPSASTALVSSIAPTVASSPAIPDDEPEPLPSSSDDSIEEGGEDAAVDASIDASDPDALSDAKGDAAKDARPVWDAKDEDAPLMGAKTYFDETPERGLRKITSNAAKVHKAPKDGTSIASLPKGTDVYLVASIWDWYRVRFVDPNTGNKRQGWVYSVNFAGPRRKTCPDGWDWHDQDGGWCDRECERNTDCKAISGYKCSGTRCFYIPPEE